MFSLRIISITTVLLLSSQSLHAKNVDQDLERCAATAMKERIKPSTEFSVDTGGLYSQDLDHDASLGKAEYRMLVVNGVSGEELGIVTCIIGKSGDVLASVLES